MKTRYEQAYQAALEKAIPVGQVDFCESLDLCLLESIERPTGVTIARAIEMMERFAHYCEILAKLAPAVYAERERCANIASQMDCKAAPPGYSITAPGLEGLCEDWQRQQCYHGDRIAEGIREATR